MSNDKIYGMGTFYEDNNKIKSEKEVYHGHMINGKPFCSNSDNNNNNKDEI